MDSKSKEGIQLGSRVIGGSVEFGYVIFSLLYFYCTFKIITRF